MEVNLYNFDDKENYKQFEKMSGIYAILYKEKVIYVGQSNDIKRRLSSHRLIDKRIEYYAQPRAKRNENGRKNMLSFYCFLRDNLEDIKFLAFGAKESDLNRLEKYYISKYKPAFNYSGVRMKYLPVERVGA